MYQTRLIWLKKKLFAYVSCVEIDLCRVLINIIRVLVDKKIVISL